MNGWWIMGAVALAVALLITWLVINHKVIKPYKKRKRYEAWQEDERNVWLEAYREASADDERLKNLKGPNHDWINDEVKQAQQAIQEAKDRLKNQRYERQADEAAVFYDKLRITTDPRARWKLLKEASRQSIRYFDDGDVTFEEHELDALKALAEDLLQEARAGRSKSFHKLQDLVFEEKYAGSARYYQGVKEGITLPDDWDELVVRYYKNPSVNQFKVQREYAPNEILLVATEALRTHDFVVAKLVLAYSMKSRKHESGYGASHHSQKYWPFRDAVGETLLTELAVLVDRVHLERGLFQEQAIPATPVGE